MIEWYKKEIIQRLLKKEKQKRGRYHKLPLWVRAAIIAVSLFPFIFNLVGVDFSSPFAPIEIEDGSGEHLNHLMHSLSGAIVHFLLEWSAVMIALATAILAIIQYQISGNPATPIIGIALLCSGVMDGFHALAATQIIQSTADNVNFIPFTWALARMFNAIILSLGAFLFLTRKKRTIPRKKRNRMVWINGGAFILASYLVVQICATSSNLPQTMFPNELWARPFDIAPLIIFCLLGLLVLPRFYEKEKSVFTHALLWSMVPAVATQLHMAFGSTQLFDNHFNIAHFLKVVYYLIPFTGMAIDYILSYKMEKARVLEVSLARRELEIKNRELEQFAYIASHDLQEPLRTLTSFTEIFADEFKEQMDQKGQTYLNYITQASTRMSALVKGLMEYSRIGKTEIREPVNTQKLAAKVVDQLLQDGRFPGAQISFTGLPTIQANPKDIQQLFYQLLDNALKFKHPDHPPKIIVSAESSEKFHTLKIQDNGIGMDPKHFQRVFSIFQRLHNKKTYEGIGIGLSICQKIIDSHNGKIWIESTPGQGTTFFVSFPKQAPKTNLD